MALSVAVPWGLSHYIPLNAFHPLYRAIFDECPAGIDLNAWDNIELSNMLKNEESLVGDMLSSTDKATSFLCSALESPLIQKYGDAFFQPNIALTSLLPGDIELHHTAPYPSMTRPFVFHCESFAPIFFPFVQQGGGGIQNFEILRDHYGKIFESPLCLGIFSHIPHTLAEISRFFKSSRIDEKLYSSRSGLSRPPFAKRIDERVSRLGAPCFLFINSANQNPDNFIHRGGHIVLRFWLNFIRSYADSRLYLRCARPTDDVLMELGVDIARLRLEEGRSIIWIQEFVSNHELNRLVSHVHFFLLPSASLHSVSIMQAMALGAVPIVTDTLGTEQYVTDGVSGIILRGVRESNWKIDPETGLSIDNYHRNKILEDDLIEQIEKNILRLLNAPADYEAMRMRAIECGDTQFSGALFAQTFWNSVQNLWDNYTGHRDRDESAFKAMPQLQHCLVDTRDWPRIFESVPQPMGRIYTGRGRVTELAGAFVYTEGNKKVGLHDWCVLAEYFKSGAPALTYVHNISELGGIYLSAIPTPVASSFSGRIAKLLFPYPWLYRLTSRMWKLIRGRRNIARFRNEPGHVDIRLIAQNISGMNIIRCNGSYYAISQDAGAFSEEKANQKKYDICFKASSLKRVLSKISEHEQQSGLVAQRPSALGAVPILVEEGVLGFNVIQFGERFFAIPQVEGAFDHERAMANGYSRLHIGASLDDTKNAIKGPYNGQ